MALGLVDSGFLWYCLGMCLGGKEMGGALHLLDGAVPPFWAVIVPLVDKFRASGWLSRVCAGRVGGASPIHSSEQGVLGKLGRRMRCTALWTRAGVRATHPACSGAGGERLGAYSGRFSGCM